MIKTAISNSGSRCVQTGQKSTCIFNSAGAYIFLNVGSSFNNVVLNRVGKIYKIIGEA